MNQVDAYKLLASELAAYREMRFEDLAQFVGPQCPRRIRGNDGTEYAVQIKVRRGNLEHGEIIVEGWLAIDDCGPMHRLDDSFIVRPSAPHNQALKDC